MNLGREKIAAYKFLRYYLLFLLFNFASWQLVKLQQLKVYIQHCFISSKFKKDKNVSSCQAKLEEMWQNLNRSTKLSACSSRRKTRIYLRSVYLQMQSLNFKISEEKTKYYNQRVEKRSKKCNNTHTCVRACVCCCVLRCVHVCP